MNQIDPLTVSQMGIAEVIALIPKLKPGWFSEDVRKKTREYRLPVAPEGAARIGEMIESRRVLVYLETALTLGFRKQLINLLGIRGVITNQEFAGYVELLTRDQQQEFDGIVRRSKAYHSLFVLTIDQALREDFGSQIPADHAPMVCKRFEAFSVPACPCCGMPYDICDPCDEMPDSVFLESD